MTTLAEARKREKALEMKATARKAVLAMNVVGEMERANPLMIPTAISLRYLRWKKEMERRLERL